MLESIKEVKTLKRLRKSALYARVRQYLPMSEPDYVDDRDRIEDAEIVTIDWPVHVEKPKIGIVRDHGPYPRWTKYCQFLDRNSFPYDLYNIHTHDWIENAAKYDIVIGHPSSELFHLEEMRRKYFFLETYLGKTCYPSTNHAVLFEDKSLQAYISKVFGIPFANTYVSHDKNDAMHLAENLPYPVVCKIVPSSGSAGTELVRTRKRGRAIVEQAFSRIGRKSHLVYFRQKNYIYFQEYVPNDGYDIRAIVIGNWVFGYYRKVLADDFRASGMGLVERRALPEEAMEIARKANEIIKSPMLAVDMLHGLDGRYHVIEFSPICRMETSVQLAVNGVPGVYVFDEDGSFHFEEGRYWAQELILREFLLNDHLPKVLTEKASWTKSRPAIQGSIASASLRFTRNEGTC